MGKGCTFILYKYSIYCIYGSLPSKCFLQIMSINIFFAVAPTVKVPNQLLGAPLDTDVQLECYVEAFPNTINYWVKNRGEMLLDG